MGQEAIELAALAGLHLDPWQQWLLDQSLRQTDKMVYNDVSQMWERKWAAVEVGLVVSRQNGKGSLLEARELAGLFILGERLIIHSAHQFDTSKEAFGRILQLIEGSDDLRKHVQKISNSHGEEGIKMRNGQRLRFRTRTKGGGRGFTGDCLILDEAMYLAAQQISALMPTLSARPNPQIWYTGSAGDKESTQLGSVRARGVKGGDPELFYAEWSINGCNDFCPPYGCQDHDRPDTVESYAKANPGLGIRITVSHVEMERRSMEAQTFAQERLGVGDWPINGDEWGVIPEDAWKSREREDSVIKDDDDIPQVFAIDTSPGREWSAITMCGQNEDELTHIEVTSNEIEYDHRPGVKWVVKRAKELWDTGRFNACVIDKTGQAGSFIGELEEYGVEIISPNSYEYAQACGDFYSSTVPRKGNEPDIVHLDQPPLNSAVAGADKRDLADKWAWNKRTSSSDITPLVAATNAVWGYRKLLHEAPAAATPWMFRA